MKAYPTDSKEREKKKRDQLKAEGKVVEPKKKKFNIEDHFDDCGEDLSSIDTLLTLSTCTPCTDLSECSIDTDSDIVCDEQLVKEHGVFAYPIDESRVAQPQPGEIKRGRDSRAPKPEESTCPACRYYRPRNDWEHSREIGQCSYPHDKPVIPKCEACVKRLPNSHHQHTFEYEKCRWGARTATGRAPATSRPHDPRVKHHEEPTTHAPIAPRGEELGAKGEE
jgi:hypothetical protein